jgi:hypothetical protein
MYMFGALNRAPNVEVLEGRLDLVDSISITGAGELGKGDLLLQLLELIAKTEKVDSRVGDERFENCSSRQISHSRFPDIGRRDF